MATVSEMKATARPQVGKGAARAVRREGRVPGVIYGDDQPPLAISVDLIDLRTRIYAGRFLTTIYDIEVDGTKHRVIPRDYQLDPVMDFPLHVDFLRLGKGATIRVNIPVHVTNAEQSPGVKRGGAVNLVQHTLEVRCPPEAIPSAIDVDIGGLEINHSKHLSDVVLPEGVKVVGRLDFTLVTIVPPSGYAEEQKAAAEAAAAAAAAGAVAAAPAQPLERRPRRLQAEPLRRPLPPAARRSKPSRPFRPGEQRSPSGRIRVASDVPRQDRPPCCCLSVSAIREARYAGNRHNIGAMALEAIARKHGIGPARKRFQGAAAEGAIGSERVLLLMPHTFMNDSGRAVAEAARFYKLDASQIVVLHDELELPPLKVRVKVGGGNAGHNGLRSITEHIGNDYKRVRIGIGHPGHQGTGAALRAAGFRQERTRGLCERCARRSPTMPPCSPRARTQAFRTRCISPCRRRALASAKPDAATSSADDKKSTYGPSMGFKCGIVGLPNVGKSTLFNALTQTAAAQAANYPFCTIEPNVGEVAVPDPRLDELARLAKSAQIVPTRLTFVDIAGLVRGASRGEGLGNQFLANIREVDAIAHVVRCFEDVDVTHVEGAINPIADIDVIETELMLADLDSLERRLEPLEKRVRGGDKEAKETLDLVERALGFLRDGKPARLVVRKA